MTNSVYIFFFILTFSSPFTSYAQQYDQQDSLKGLLNQAVDMPDSTIANLLHKILLTSTSPDEILAYSALQQKHLERYPSVVYSIEVYHFNGVAYRLKGNIRKSLSNLFKSARMAVKHKEHLMEAEAYMEIANTYTANNDPLSSLYFEKKGINIIRKYGKKKQLGIGLLNIGFSYYTLNKIDSALVFYNEAEPIMESINMAIGKAYVKGNRALVYWKKGEYARGEQDLLAAIDMLEPLNDHYGMADYHNQLSNLYFEKHRHQEAITHTELAIKLATELDLKEQMRDAMLLLSLLYREEKDYAKALHYQSAYIAYKDSIENSQQTKKIANMRTSFEVDLKEKEISILEKREALNQTYIIIIIILLLLSIVLLLYFRQRFVMTRLVMSSERKEHNDKINNLLSAHETKALQAIIQGSEAERKRLAKDLHNHFGSLLATIKVHINGIDEDAISNHATLTQLVNQACNDIRNMSHTLNMGISENFGLVPALEELTQHLHQSTGMQVEFSATACDGLMSSENEIMIYRIVQELVSNVLKHAQATQLSILLTCFEDENLVNILVQDNGIGFDTAIVKHKSGGIGLHTLKQMVTDIDGEIVFDSNPRSGTTININLPLSLEPSIL